MSKETGRQRFLRNSSENIRIMRAAAKRQLDAGNFQAAEAMEEMARTWEGIEEKARIKEGG